MIDNEAKDLKIEDVPCREDFIAGKPTESSGEVARLSNFAFISDLFKTTCGIFAAHPLQKLIELKEHPFFTAYQFHPEFLSRPGKPHPLFQGLIEAAQLRLPASPNEALRQTQTPIEHELPN